MIVDAERIRLLKTNGLFKGISDSTLKPYLKPKYFFEAKEGEILYVCGDTASDLFLLVEGEVKIKFSCNGNSNVKHKYLSDFFGEDELLKGSERTSSAIANTNCVLFKISSSELKQLSSTDKRIDANLHSKGEVENNAAVEEEQLDYQSQDLQTTKNYSEESDIETPENSDDGVDWILPDDQK